jgi:hypothetical protein
MSPGSRHESRLVCARLVGPGGLVWRGRFQASRRLRWSSWRQSECHTRHGQILMHAIGTLGLGEEQHYGFEEQYSRRGAIFTRRARRMQEWAGVRVGGHGRR